MRNLFLIFLLSATAHAQAWSTIIEPTRAIDWTHAGVIGGIPNNRTQCGATIQPSGATDITDKTNIEAAIQACGANQYVQLGAGQFNIVNGVTFGGTRNHTPPINNVTLKGMGPGQTTLKLLNLGTSSTNCAVGGTICFQGSDEDFYQGAQYTPYGGACTWTGPYNKGATQLTLGTCAGAAGNATGGLPVVGQHIVLSQRNDDIGLSGCTSSGTTATCTVGLAAVPSSFTVGKCVGVGETSVAGYTGPATYPQRPVTNCQGIISSSGNTFRYTLPAGASNLAASTGGSATVDTGGTYLSAIEGATAAYGLLDIGFYCPDYRNPPNPACTTGEISRRSNFQVVTVTAVNGNQITIDTPLYSNQWRAAQSPGVSWYSLSAYHHDDGIENLTIDARYDGGSGTDSLMNFHACYNCWARNIRSIGGSRNHIWITDGSAHVTIRDSYFFGSKRGATLSYGVELFGAVSDVLVENNIFQHIPAGMMPDGGPGLVAGYNTYFDDGQYNIDWLFGMISANHGTTGFTLYESEDAGGIAMDNIHGTLWGSITLFRNRLRGQQVPVKSNALSAIELTSGIRGVNIVGNVLGTIGVQDTLTNPHPSNLYYDYQQIATGGVDCDACIYFLGQSGQSVTYIADDPLTRSTLLRWGNYDVITAAITPASGGIRWCGTGLESGCSPCVNSNGQMTNTGSQCTEVPGAVPYMNANFVPSSHTLPPSFYLAAKPSWFTTKWGTPPWPASGSDITGGMAEAGGHYQKIPSRLAYDNAPLDTNYAVSTQATGGSCCTSSSYGNLATLNGVFTSSPVDTVQVTGASPAAYNGTYQVVATNGLLGPSDESYFQSGGTITYPGAGYRVAETRVNAVGETTMGPIGRPQGLSGNCPAAGNNCTLHVPSPCSACTANGSGCASGYSGTCNGNQMGTGYNIYVQIEGSPNAIMCKQNASPIPIGTDYVRSTPFVFTSCIQPPAVSTIPTTWISYMMATNPGNMTTMGTVTEPLVRQFDANQYYNIAAGAPTEGLIQGKGTVQGQGTIK